MYHFTLPHRQISIAMRVRTWIFPDVTMANVMKTRSRNRKVQSTTNRKVGCKEDPGVRILSKNDMGLVEDTFADIM